MSNSVYTEWGTGKYSPVNDSTGDHVFLAPKFYKGDGTKRGVLSAHTAGQSGGQPLDVATFPQLSKLFSAIAAAGYPILHIKDAGDTWGASSGDASVTDGFNYLTGHYGAKSTKVLLFGISHANVVLMNWARANTAKVSGIIGIEPVSDINDMVTNNRGGFAAGINTAYGTYNQATMGATRNPVTYAADLAAIPTKLWYAASDTIVMPSTVTSLASGIGANASAVSVAGSHGDAMIANVPLVDVLAFLAAHE